MKRLTSDTPSGNFETILNFVYGKDGWAYIRHDGEHENVLLTDWAKRQCLLRGCDEVMEETAEDVDQWLCDCMMDEPICPIAMAYCFASQAVHLRSRLKMYEDAMPLERAQELAQAEKNGRLVVLPCKTGDTLWSFYNYPKNGIYKIVVTAVSTLDGITVINTDNCGVIPEKDIGKTVFLTREEAEAALKRRMNDGATD